MSYEFVWSFWMSFQHPRGWGDVGWGGVNVTVRLAVGGLEQAVARANTVVQAVAQTDADDVCIYFASNTPFSVKNLTRVECDLDGEGISHLAYRDDNDFTKQVGLFLEQHAIDHSIDEE